MKLAQVIAHRGASAYAPENTFASFELAIAQEAGWVEHDLQVTRDGVLVCLHDRTLERTTNVRDVLPRRRELCDDGANQLQWHVHDFTWAEVQQLDAGAWFGAEFSGVRIPTFDELLDWSRHRVRVLTELKDPEIYEDLGIDMLQLCGAALRRHGLLTDVGESTVHVQSFHQPTVRRATEWFASLVPAVWLVDAFDRRLLSEQQRVAAIGRFASGIGPAKSIVADHPEIVAWAHAAGLRVTPWTFRSGATGSFDSVRAEMKHHLTELGVDAVITDHPDQAG
jgi:glycerophosphoryl diester phosphodiesterase